MAEEKHIDKDFLAKLRAADARIRIVDCDYSRVKEISRKWFNRNKMIRCQAGTPIYAFLFGLEQCKNNKIIRSDCDILFFNNGFMDQLNTDDHPDIVQLPRLNDEPIEFSTRQFFIQKQNIEKKLPLAPFKLDLIRRLHRYVNNRSSYLALEQMIQLNIEKGKLTFEKYSTRLGYTMHVSKRQEFADKDIAFVEQLFRSGKIPVLQLAYNHDYQKELWDE